MNILSVAKKLASLALITGMLFWWLTLTLPSKVIAADLVFPTYKGYVNDFENILNNDQQLEAKLQSFAKEKGVEVAIVTTRDFQGTYIEDYAVKLFEQWKIGDKELDNGLLILISATQREARIEVGYGLEGTITDIISSRIQNQEMIPYFTNGDYSTGVEKGVDAIIGYVDKDPLFVSNLSKDQNTTQISSSGLEFMIFALIVLFSIMGSTKSWWLGGVIGIILGIIIGLAYFKPTGWLILPIPLGGLGLVIDFLLSKTGVGRSLLGILGSTGRGGGFGGSGGGFTFGGGSSGGGGSSSKW